MAKHFAICIPDFVNKLIWCQHHNGSWAPPFPMSDTDTKDSPKDESDVEEDS